MLSSPPPSSLALSHILRAHVEPDGEDLVITWQLDGDEVAVDVASGASPIGIDHEHVSTVAAGTLLARIPGTAASRPFVSLTPHGGGGALIAAERRLPFDGIGNFRDLGGYRLKNGAHTRWGMVFRADSLHAMTDADIDAFHRLGIKTVWDLRRDEEREVHPNRVPATPAPVIGRDPNGPMSPDLTVLAIESDGERLLRDIYIGALAYCAGQIGDIYRAMASEQNLPSLFHCHAGKDRTGIVAALLLSALGVDRQDIIDDYALTERYRGHAQARASFEGMIARGVAPEAAVGVLGAPRWAMEEALDVLESKYDGIESFLTGPAGLTAEELDSLRRALTQPG